MSEDLKAVGDLKAVADRQNAGAAHTDALIKDLEKDVEKIKAIIGAGGVWLAQIAMKALLSFAEKKGWIR